MRRELRLLSVDGLGTRLLAAFLLVTIVPLAVVGALLYRSGEAAVRAELVVLLLLICGAGVVGVRFAWGITRPIKRLARAAAAIGDGKLDQHVEEAGPPEIVALARAFNGMAHDLTRSRTELEAKVTERTRNLTALLEVTQALGSTLDLTETLWCAARSLVRVLHAEAGVAYVLDEDNQTLRPVAGYQLPPLMRGHTDRMSIAVTAHTFVEEACASHQTTFTADAPADPRVDRALLELWGFRSLLFVPMCSRGRLVGGLFAGWEEPRAPLAHQDLNLLDGIGRQAGVAVQNAALFSESERRRQSAETLAELDAVLAGSLDRRVVTEGIVRGARGLLQAPVAFAYGLDVPSGNFHVLAVDGLPTDQFAAAIPRGVGIGSLAVDQLTVIASADVLADPRIHLTRDLRHRVGRSGLTAMLAAPLRVGDRVIGVLYLAAQRGRVFTHDEGRLLRTFASQAALALENVRLYDEAKARAARMTRLGEFGRMITSSLNLPEVLDRVAGAARDLVNADLAGVWVADAEKQVVRLMALEDRTGAAVRGALTELPLGVGVVGYVMTERRPHYSPNVGADEFDADDWLKAGGYTSRLSVPLIVSDRPVGVLTILTKAPREFSREEQEIVELFASEAATAVENARLFADTEAQAAVLAKKNAELDAFTYSVSHDLKAPLVTIQAMFGMVMEDQGERLDDDGRRILKRIEANALHMAQLISDLLALSKIGREAREPEAVVIREVIETVVDRHNEMIRARGVEIVCTADVTVWGIRVHLEQVFANIVGNAVKYIGETTTDPRVEIRAEDDGGRFVEFSVHDNGIGIDPAYHARIFELFQRLRDVEAEGTGVGLALVKKIIDTVGGRIWVESTPGEGATFRFTWPASAPVRTA